jgi:hypothetical protein
MEPAVFIEHPHARRFHSCGNRVTFLWRERKVLMMNMEFSQEEVEVLREMLRRGGDGLDVEISRTDSIEFKQMLIKRREIMEQIAQKLSAPPEEIRRAA